MKYVVDGSSTQTSYDGDTSYATWRVVLASDPKHLICAFFGGASFSAASVFCNHINNSPEWN